MRNKHLNNKPYNPKVDAEYFSRYGGNADISGEVYPTHFKNNETGETIGRSKQLGNAGNGEVWERINDDIQFPQQVINWANGTVSQHWDSINSPFSVTSGGTYSAAAWIKPHWGNVSTMNIQMVRLNQNSPGTRGVDVYLRVMDNGDLKSYFTQNTGGGADSSNTFLAGTDYELGEWIFVMVQYRNKEAFGKAWTQGGGWTDWIGSGSPTDESIRTGANTAFIRTFGTSTNVGADTKVLNLMFGDNLPSDDECEAMRIGDRENYPSGWYYPISNSDATTGGLYYGKNNSSNILLFEPYTANQPDSHETATTLPEDFKQRHYLNRKGYNQRDYFTIINPNFKNLGDITTTKESTTEIAFKVWFRTADTATKTIFSKYNLSVNAEREVAVTITNGQLYVNIGVDSGNDVVQYRTNLSTYNDGEWHYLAFRYEVGGSVFMVLDDQSSSDIFGGLFFQETGDTSLALNSNPTVQDLKLGAMSNGTGNTWYLTGDVGEFSIQWRDTSNEELLDAFLVLKDYSTNTYDNTDYIPASLVNPDLDIFGNPLEYKGRLAPRGKIVDNACLVLNGVDQFVKNNYLFTGSIQSAKIRMKFRFDSSGFYPTLFNIFKDSSNYFGLSLHISTQEIRCIRASGSGQHDTLTGFNVTYGQWYDLEVDFDSDTSFTMTIDKVDYRFEGLDSRSRDAVFQDSSIFLAVWNTSSNVGNVAFAGVEFEINGQIISQLPCSEGNGVKVNDKIQGISSSVTNAVLPDIWGLQDVFAWNFFKGFESLEPETKRMYEDLSWNTAIKNDAYILDRFVKNLKKGHNLVLGEDNLNTIFDTLYVHATPSLSPNVPHLDNLVTGDVADRITVTTGVGVVTEDVGFGLDFKTSRASHNSLQTITNVATIDDFALFSYVTEAEGLADGVYSGLYGNFNSSQSTYISIGNESGQLVTYTRINTDTGGFVRGEISSEIGLYYAERIGNDVTHYKDGVNLGSYNRVSTSMATSNFAIANIIGLSDVGFLGKLGISGIGKATLVNQSVIKSAFDLYLFELQADQNVLNDSDIVKKGYEETGKWNGAGKFQFPDIPSIPSSLRGQKFSKDMIPILASEKVYLNNDRLRLFNEIPTPLEQNRYGLMPSLGDALVTYFDFTNEENYTFDGNGDVVSIKDVHGKLTLTASGDVQFLNGAVYIPDGGSGRLTASEDCFGDLTTFEFFTNLSAEQSAGQGYLLNSTDDEAGGNLDSWGLIKHGIASFRYYSTYHYDSVNGNESLGVTAQWAAFNQYIIHNYYHDGTNLFSRYDEGSEVDEGAISPPSNNDRIGKGTGSSFYINPRGYMKGFILFNRVLTDEEKSIVRNLINN